MFSRVRRTSQATGLGAALSGIAILSLLSLACRPQAHAPTQTRGLTVVSYGGGAYQESHRKAFCEPFALYSGADVQSTTWNAEYGKLKTMVASGRVQWDVVEVTAAQFERGKAENLFAPLTVKPSDGDFLPHSVTDVGVANVYWGTVLAYRKAAFPTNPPQTWADFFDLEKYPGTRALYDDPRANLEFALLADGVPLSQLYPLDVDRAFRKLDTLKKHVRVWWKDGTQPVQLLLTNEVDVSSAWNGRIYASEPAREKIGYSWKGAALELDYWVVPRGSVNQDAASRFIAYASSPYALARQTEAVGYGPVNLTALGYVPPEVRRELPTDAPNWEISFVVDARWWAENEETVQTRWLSWKAQ